MAREHDVPLVRALGARVLAAAIDRGPEEVSSGVETGRVDVVIFGEVAHLGLFRRYGEVPGERAVMAVVLVFLSGRGRTRRRRWRCC